MNDKKIKRKEYQRDYQRKWIKKRRQDWVDDNGPCRQCGSSESLEVDHIRREDKTMHTASIWSKRKEVRDLELSKCQVLCKVCHLKKTIEESNYPGLIHGSISGYDKHKCRCEDCKLTKRKRSMKSKNPKKYKELYGDE
jgi:5-methylcytosine-specific restriction endonuclease McrA